MTKFEGGLADEIRSSALAQSKILGALVLLSCCAVGWRQAAPPQFIPLTSAQGLFLVGTKAEVTNYKGRKAIHLTEDVRIREIAEAVALIKGADFSEGSIDVDVAGFPGVGAPAYARGYVGIAFRAKPRGEEFESFYLRPTNGRAADQLRRNHCTQYAEYPDYPWYRLRKENPGLYESYVDIQSGVWTHMRIVVKDTHASLYINHASQPCLIVNDLKGKSNQGLIGLWVGVGTEAYFSNLKIVRRLESGFPN